MKHDEEQLDDAISELMMLTSSEVAPMLLIGEAFVVSSEESASEYCQNKLEVS